MMASLAGGALSVQAAAKTDLTIAVDADVDTLHSTDYSTTVEHDILSQIYDTLMYMNPDGSHDPEPRTQNPTRSATTDWITPSI